MSYITHSSSTSTTGPGPSFLTPLLWWAFYLRPVQILSLLGVGSFPSLFLYIPQKRNPSESFPLLADFTHHLLFQLKDSSLVAFAPAVGFWVLYCWPQDKNLSFLEPLVRFSHFLIAISISQLGCEATSSNPTSPRVDLHQADSRVKVARFFSC